MTATAPLPTTTTRRTAQASVTRPVPFVRLTLVELRKQVDTRAGVWLLAIIVVLNAALSALVLFTAEPAARTWQDLTTASSWGQLLLLPLIGILAATGEWSQRTSLTTFTLEPRRTRVNGAKLASASLLGLGVMVGALFAGALLNVAGVLWLDGDGSWTMEWALLGGMLLALLLLVTQGLAFGLALLSTPIAIVAYLVLPTVWTILTMLVSALEGPARWLNLDSTIMPLMDGQMTGEAWAQLATSSAVWIGLPLAIGLWRTARRDVT